MDKYKLFDKVEKYHVELSEVDENCDAEDEEETISNMKKSQFEKPVHTAGPSGGPSIVSKMHDFAEEGELEKINDDIRKEAEQKDKLYYQILHSRNKDFGTLLQTSESQSSELEFAAKSHRTGNLEQVAKQTKAAAVIQHYLQMQIRQVLKQWRDHTDLMANEQRFRVRNYRLLL